MFIYPRSDIPQFWKFSFYVCHLVFVPWKSLYGIEKKIWTSYSKVLNATTMIMCHREYVLWARSWSRYFRLGFFNFVWTWSGICRQYLFIYLFVIFWQFPFPISQGYVSFIDGPLETVSPTQREWYYLFQLNHDAACTDKRMLSKPRSPVKSEVKSKVKSESSPWFIALLMM